MFTEQGVNTFFKETYTTTAKCDRMGFRLDGPEIETVNGSDIISDGIALGAVQIPNHGRPIIMLADRQTTGGYAKIGTVASVDIPKLVQCKPGGDSLRGDKRPGGASRVPQGGAGNALARESGKAPLLRRSFAAQDRTAPHSDFGGASQEKRWKQALDRI